MRHRGRATQQPVARTRKKLGDIRLDGRVCGTRYRTYRAHEPNVACCVCTCWVPLVIVEFLTHEIGEELQARRDGCGNCNCTEKTQNKKPVRDNRG